MWLIPWMNDRRCTFSSFPPSRHEAPNGYLYESRENGGGVEGLKTVGHDWSDGPRELLACTYRADTDTGQVEWTKAPFGRTGVQTAGRPVVGVGVAVFPPPIGQLLALISCHYTPSANDSLRGVGRSISSLLTSQSLLWKNRGKKILNYLPSPSQEDQTS